ncbi:MAG: amidohydrolase family protein [Gemmatimonadota bacterium]|nr:MAG: amidohydrolase family protein [Gemmatimonadota bacterium]
MQIDAHQHFWHYDPVRDGWITEEMAVLKRDFLPDDLRPLIEAQGVEGTVAVQADQSEDETDFLLQLAASHPFIKGVVGWVDLRAPMLGKRLEHFSRFEHLCGVRHIAQAEADDFLARDDVVRGIGLLSDFGLTYDILVYPQQLLAALSLVEKLPDSPFVVDHLAKPLIRQGKTEPWATHMRELAQHQKVCCKVSGLVTEADWRRWRPEDIRPYLDLAFEAFGPDRLMFGSDWPVCTLAASYREVWELLDGYASQFSASERGKLFGGNAARFYGLAV